MAREARLGSIVARTQAKRDLAGVIVRIERGDGGFGWTGSAGELGHETPFFIASTTKLYTTAVVLRLAEAGRLTLDDRLVDHLEPGVLSRLHVHRGTEYTGRITVRHLLSHTSGLPDYFQGKRRDGTTLERTLRDGRDMAWDLDDVLATAWAMGAAFPPGVAGRALYSDTNFQLLGRIIEVATAGSYAEAVRREVLEPLGLRGSWLYTDPTDARPALLRDKGRPLRIPRAMASFGPDGGVVAPVGELMRFVRAFFEGGLFDRAALEPLKTYHRIFFPLQYGVGFARFKLPRIFSPLAAPPELLGHSGLSGAFAFHAPKEDVFLAGTVNDVARPDVSFRLMLELLHAL